MTLAALSMRDDTVASYGEVRSGLSTEWADWLNDCEILSVAVPNGVDGVGDLLDRIDPDILILTGGNDTVPGSDASRVSPRRDETERGMISWAIGNGKPIFGVCRGLQMINRYFGGTVTANLPGPPKVHVATHHEVRLEGRLREVFNTSSVDVNSFHDQGVLPDDLAEDLELCGLSPDGIVEGVAHKTLPIIAVQWHPERRNGAAALCAQLVSHLLPQGGEVSK